MRKKLIIIIFFVIFYSLNVSAEVKQKISIETANLKTISEIFKSQNIKKNKKISGNLYLPSENNRYPLVILQHGTGSINNLKKTISEMKKLFLSKKIALFVADSYGGRGTKKVSTASRLYDSLMILNTFQNNKNIDKSKIYFVGMSYGGYVAQLVNNATLFNKVNKELIPFKGIVGIYPSCTLQWENQKLISPMMFILGKKDNWTNPAACTELISRIKNQSLNVTINEYDGHHGWMLDGKKKTLSDTWKDNVENCGTGRIDDQGYFSWGGSSEKKSGWSGFINGLKQKKCYSKGVTIEPSDNLRTKTINAVLDFILSSS